MRATRRQWWMGVRFAIGLGVGLVALYLLLRDVDRGALWGALRAARPLWLLAALAMLLTNILAKSLRWRRLLATPGRGIALRALMEALLVGQLVNSLLPARAGDLTRAHLAGNHGMRRSYVLGTIAIEKLIEIASYLLLFLLIFWLMPLPAWMTGRAPLVVGGALALIGGALLLAARRRQSEQLLARSLDWLPSRVRTSMLSQLGAALSSLDVLQGRRVQGEVILLSLVVWTTGILVNYSVLRALAIQAPFVSAMVVLLLLQLSLSLLTVPGNIGVFEYLCVVALSLFAVDETLALSYGILLHAIVLVAPLLGLLLYLFARLPLAGRTLPDAPPGSP